MKRCKYAPVYQVIESTMESEDNGSYVGYGLTCHRKDFFGGKDTVRVIEDMSTDRELVSSIGDLFNLCCLPVDCFKDAVIDLLS